jgi:CRP/FNR family transcriptional regulator, transcriptional activator FtrB
MSTPAAAIPCFRCDSDHTNRSARPGHRRIGAKHPENTLAFDSGHVGVEPPPSARPATATPHDALAAAPWLGAVPAATLGRLSAHAVLHRVPAGSILFDQAETPAFAFCLVGGSVALLGVRDVGETLVEIIRPVDLLLPAAVLNRQPYLLRARALDEAHLVLIQAETFRHAVTSDHALCLALLACEAAHFRRRVKHAKNIMLRSAEERVGCYLLKLAEQADPDTPPRLVLEKRLIASQLGMTRETFSRNLGAVAKHGLRVNGDHLVVEDIAAARKRFRLDPLIDGPEPMLPMQHKRT